MPSRPVRVGGEVVGDPVAEALAPWISALSDGLATIAGAVIIGLLLPAFARYQAQPNTQPQQPAQPSPPALATPPNRHKQPTQQKTPSNARA
jgi:hypothetical protein